MIRRKFRRMVRPMVTTMVKVMKMVNGTLESVRAQFVRVICVFSFCWYEIYGVRCFFNRLKANTRQSLQTKYAGCTMVFIWLR